MDNQITKLKAEVKALNGALGHLRDTYMNKILYEKST